VTQDQRTRLDYLRQDLKVWEDRRHRARWSLAADKLYNSSAMDQALGEMIREMNDLEGQLEKPKNKRRPYAKLEETGPPGLQPSQEHQDARASPAEPEALDLPAPCEGVRPFA
jgi:hypothetical protein